MTEREVLQFVADLSAMYAELDPDHPFARMTGAVDGLLQWMDRTGKPLVLHPDFDRGVEWRGES